MIVLTLFIIFGHASFLPVLLELMDQWHGKRVYAVIEFSG